MFRKFILWLTETKFWSWLLLDFMPGKRFTWKVPSIKGRTYSIAHMYLGPGDILVSIDTRALTGAVIKYLSKGQFSHACMCVGKWPEDKYEIGEMLAHGYTQNFFYDLVHESERVVILRPNWPPNFRDQVIECYKSFLGTPYDVKMALDTKALYCSESVWQAVQLARRIKPEYADYNLDVDLEDFAGLGRQYLSPTGIYEAKNLTIIYDTDWGKVWG